VRPAASTAQCTKRIFIVLSVLGRPSAFSVVFGVVFGIPWMLLAAPPGRAWAGPQMPAAAASAAPPAGTPAAPGRAAHGDPAEDRRADLYRDGVAAASAGKWTEARDRFAAALAIRPSPKIHFSLAQSEEQLGLVASAQADYLHALEVAKSAKQEDVVAAAEKAIANIAPRVPHVRVVIAPGGAGASAATATLDDAPIALEAPIAVDPGTHRVVVAAPGSAPTTTNVAIGERQQLEVPVTLATPAGAPPAGGGEPAEGAGPPLSDATEGAPRAPGAGPRSAWPTVGLVTAGAGVAAMGLGAYFGLDAKSKNDASNASGCSGDACTAAAAETRREALASADRANVAFAVGGVLAATGVTLWWLCPRGDVSVAPAAGASGGGVTVRGVW
jgi:hypothetical protein